MKKYRHDINLFYEFLPDEKVLTKEDAIRYQQHLIEKGYAATSINSMLVAMNKLPSYIGAADCRVRSLKQQRRIFCDMEGTYSRRVSSFVSAAQRNGNMRLARTLQTICSTGIRVSELEYITFSALKRQEAQVHCKGKIRKVLLPKTLCTRLLAYCREQDIRTGSVFVTHKGKPINRSNICYDEKVVCACRCCGAKSVPT
ncbi:MAG: hypothetical protein V8T36_02055 [Ruthenibacterium lactatiformans]